MEKTDIRPGMLVELGSGGRYIASQTKDGEIKFVNNHTSAIRLSDYYDDLIPEIPEVEFSNIRKRYTVNKIWSLHKDGVIDFSGEGREMLWDRNNPQVSDIDKYNAREYSYRFAEKLVNMFNDGEINRIYISFQGLDSGIEKGNVKYANQINIHKDGTMEIDGHSDL